jgi:hypothetical protein
MTIIRQFLDPILAEAVTKRRSSGPQHLVDVKGTDREVEEGETLVEHLLNYTEGHTSIPPLSPLYMAHFLRQIVQSCAMRS